MWAAQIKPEKAPRGKRKGREEGEKEREGLRLNQSCYFYIQIM